MDRQYVDKVLERDEQTALRGMLKAANDKEES